MHGAKRDAQRELRAILTSIDGGAYVDPTELTLADWLREWLTWRGTAWRARRWSVNVDR